MSILTNKAFLIGAVAGYFGVPLLIRFASPLIGKVTGAASE